VGERGQAAIELVAGLPALLLAGLVALQLLAAGYALTLADGAAEAGAMAIAAGLPAEPAARAAVPAWARDRLHVNSEGGAVDVRLLPPSPLPGLARELEVSSAAWVRPPAER
jgi:hypothetical protein